MAAHADAGTTRCASIPTTTYWEHIGATTHWGRYLHDVEKRAILRAEALARPRGHAIDMGCGGGRWAKLLADRGWDVTCTEVNPDALAVCQHKLPAAKCILAHPDDRVLPCVSHSKALALCVEVIPVVEADWFPREAHRILRAHGILVGVYINGRSWRALAWRLKRLARRETTASFYNAPYSRWRRRLLGSGFEMVHEESCCWAPFSRESNSPFVPACARMERALGLHRVVSWSPWVVFIARRLP